MQILKKTIEADCEVQVDRYKRELANERQSNVALEKHYRAIDDKNGATSADLETIRYQLNSVLIENSELSKSLASSKRDLKSQASTIESLEHDNARIAREHLQLSKTLRMKEAALARFTKV